MTVGLNVSGGEFGTVPGVYDTDYHYDGQTSLDALYELGCRHIRVPIKMERLQPTPSAAFDATEQARLLAFLGRVVTAGLTCKIEAHNYGRRVVSSVEQLLGSAGYTQAQHADFFARLAGLVASRTEVVALGYNEPHDIPAQSLVFTPLVTHYDWETAPSVPYPAASLFPSATLFPGV